MKPANVFLDDDGNFYLGDFGIALDATTATGPEASLSAGSPAYASPEQLLRQPVGPTADVHGLAITLFEALTGQLPFPGARTQAELLQRQLHDPIPSAHAIRADVPSGIDDVLQRATAKDPACRFAQIDAFVAAFNDAMQPDAPATRTGARPRPGVAITNFVANLALPWFSADGTRLLALGTDGLVRNFDVASGEEIGDGFGPGTLMLAGKAANGGTLITQVATQPLVTMLWDSDPVEWERKACEAAGRNLTEEEWTRYLPAAGARRATCQQWPLAPSA